MIALGAVLLIAGIVYGLGSRHVQYNSVPQGSIAHYLSADGTGYLQMEGNPSLYIVHQDNFTPKLASFADSDTISFVYDPAETTSVDVKSTLGTHLAGTAAKVVAITTLDGDGKKTYTTPEYASNPKGYDHNQLPLGIGLFIAGLLLIGGSFFLRKKRTSPSMTKTTTDSAPLSTTSVPMPAWQPQPNFGQMLPPNGQSLRPATPFQQPAQNTYPTQTGPFQQVPGQGYPTQTGPFGQMPSYPQQPQGQFGQVPQSQQRPFDPSQNPGQQTPQQRPAKPSGTQFLRPGSFEPPQQ